MLYIVNLISTNTDELMKPIPNHLPPLPAGAVYLGLGGTFKTADSFFEGWAAHPCRDSGDVWDSGHWEGTSKQTHYAAPEGSEVVRLNATPVEPKCQCIVWSLSRGEPTKIHPSLESAEAEAKRLAAKHPEQTFHVAKVEASYIGSVTVTKL